MKKNKKKINTSIQARVAKMMLATQTINYTVVSQAFTMRTISDCVYQLEQAKEKGGKDLDFAIKSQQDGIDRYNAAMDNLIAAVLQANEDFLNYIDGCDGVTESDMHLINPVMKALHDEIDLDN